jgi:transcriptional regulator with XRE-family HTH domain
MSSQPKTPLIPAQIRAGRALVNWSQQQLAEAASLSLSSVRDYENERRGGIVGGLSAIKTALENQGVAFLTGDENDGPGVRMSGRFPQILRKPTSLNNDALLIPLVWRGKAYELYVHREVLDDLAGNADEPPDSKYGEIFENYRATILLKATEAIEAGRVAPDRRVHLVAGDF